MITEPNNGHATTDTAAPRLTPVAQTVLTKAMLGECDDPSTRAFAEATAKYTLDQMQAVSGQISPDVAGSVAMLQLKKWLVTACKNVYSADAGKGVALAIDGAVGADTYVVDGAFLTVQGMTFRLGLADIAALAAVLFDSAKTINAQMRANKAAEKATVAAAKAQRKAEREAKKAAAPQA